MAKYLLIVDYERRRRHADGGWEPEEVKAHIDYYGGAEPRAHRQRRAGRRRGPGRARPGQDRDVRRGRRRSSPTARSRSSRRCWPATSSSTSSPRSGRSRSPRGSRPCPGPDGVPIQQPIEVRQVMDDAPDAPRWTTASRRPAADLTAGPPSRTCCASWRRRSSASLVRRYGDFDAAEDAVQEALRRRGRRTGRPTASRNNPRGWLDPDRRRAGWSTSTAASTPAAAARTLAASPSAAAGRPPPRRDDTLILLFMCCHPSLTPASAIALTLRAVGGLTTAEIATRVPGPRGDDGASASAGPSRRSRSPACRSRCRHPTSAPARLRSGAPRPLPDLQRGLRPAAGDRAPAPTCPPRRSGWPGMVHAAAAGRPRSRRSARADAAHRRPAARPYRRRRRAGPAGRAGPVRAGTAR